MHILMSCGTSLLCLFSTTQGCRGMSSHSSTRLECKDASLVITDTDFLGTTTAATATTSPIATATPSPTAASAATLSSVSVEASTLERTLIAVKPEGIQRGVIGNIMRRFERHGFKLVAGKLMLASKGLIREHYIDHAEKSYFDQLVQDMCSGPILAMVWEGNCAVTQGRRILGTTDPLDSQPGTIRGDLCVDVRWTACHGSDSVEAAEREIDLWFGSQEVR